MKFWLETEAKDLDDAIAVYDLEQQLEPTRFLKDQMLEELSSVVVVVEENVVVDFRAVPAVQKGEKNAAIHTKTIRGQLQVTSIWFMWFPAAFLPSWGSWTSAQVLVLDF